MVTKAMANPVYDEEGNWTGKYRCPRCGAYCHIRLDTPSAPVAGKDENTWCMACGLGVPEDYKEKTNGEGDK